ncbi:MAG: riboflavin biosynthesis protein RibF [Prevotella sp.]|nr:riboflavin biosynthesis protein RibF [Prevotella sp.]
MSGYVATIGMFDGVHAGHRFVLGQVVSESRRRGLRSLCITFDHSPRHEQVLTPLAEKRQLILATGIDRVEVLPFTPALKSMTARQFMCDVLRRRLGVSVLLTGYDNRFGHNRAEGFADYRRYGLELGIDVVALPAEGSVSSSRVRQLLQDGQVDEAARCLGRPYSISGTVVHGEHLGTRLGFPTANIVPQCPQQLVPAPGVYAVTCGTLRGMMNIGTRPTFGPHGQTLEVHLFDYHGDLYGRQLTIGFVRRLRAERPFQSAAELIEQLRKDALQAQQQL